RARREAAASPPPCGPWPSDETRRSSQVEIARSARGGEDLADALGMQVAPAEPVDVAADMHVAAVEGRCDIGEERRPAARRVGAVENGRDLDVRERLSDRVARERTERPYLEQPAALAGGAQLVDDVLHRAAGPADAEDRALGVLELVRLEGRVAPPGDGRELRRDPG